MTTIGHIATTDDLKDKQDLLDELGLMRHACARLTEELEAARMQRDAMHARLLALLEGLGVESKEWWSAQLTMPLKLLGKIMSERKEKP